MIKNLDKLEKQLSSAKAAQKKADDYNKKLWNKIDDFSDKIFKKYLERDLKTLLKFFEKHSKESSGIKVDIYGKHLEIQKEYSLVDDYSSEVIQLEMIDTKAPANVAKDDFLEKYHFDEKFFKIKVAYLGDLDEYSTRPTKRAKEFDLNSKEDAYQYATDLFKKEFLNL